MTTTTYDYDSAPTDPTHGGKMTAEQAGERIAWLEARVQELEKALMPFAHFHDTLGDDEEPTKEITSDDFQLAFDLLVYR